MRSRSPLALLMLVLLVVPVLVMGLAACAQLQPDAASTAGPTSPAGLKGSTILLLMPQDSNARSQTGQNLERALVRYAQENGASLEDLAVDGVEELNARIENPSDPKRPQVVVAAEPSLIDLVDATSSQNLHQKFLILGGQLPEPTENVSAVVWTGGDSRGPRVGGPATPEATASSPTVSASTESGSAAEDESGPTAEEIFHVGFAQVFGGPGGEVITVPGAPGTDNNRD